MEVPTRALYKHFLRVKKILYTLKNKIFQIFIYFQSQTYPPNDAHMHAHFLILD